MGFELWRHSHPPDNGAPTHSPLLAIAHLLGALLSFVAGLVVAIYGATRRR